MTMKINRTHLLIGAALSAATLSGCDRKQPAPAPERPEAVETPEPVSIFRPEAEVDRKVVPMTTLEKTISFAEGGSKLTADAQAEIDSILASPQIEAGGGIILRGHTDSAGNDDANLRSSRKRAEAVRDYMVENGVDEARVEVIALGEMRPVAPNANLDGTPDEEGRAANRRVDVTVEVPGQTEAEKAAADAAEEREADEAGTLVDALTGKTASE